MNKNKLELGLLVAGPKNTKQKWGVFGVFFGVFEPSLRAKIAQIVSLITDRFLELGGRD